MVSEGIVFNRALQLRPFLDLFEKRGGQAAPVLMAAGLDRVDLNDPAALINGNALYKAVEEMADALGDPYFAARAGAAFVEAGPVFVRESYAAAHTLAEFLPLAILELDRQINNVRYSLQISADITLIRAVRSFVPAAPIVQADAATASLWVTLLRLVVKDDFDPTRMTVIAQEGAGIPPELLPKSSFLRRKWNGVQIGFPSEWLQRPLALNWQIPTTKRGEFRDTSQGEAILIWVEQVCIQRVHEKSFDLDSLAHHLGVHPKSLQRLLAELGTSFQEIRDEVRRQKALDLLSQSQPASNGEIADALGFSSAASFSRAFKRWIGVSPSDFRKTL
ncbi:AraC-like DNA-binding protein [Roseibium hamelinense]|uniref:AraC-like DNA-binding protein n=1 Tax=Roseibium hamelinense TaxID=150831 RepID=A0A562TFZ8_9HYPH|nr:AraC family transcriptional regulator [Roseibium hamelinense]MTI42438.1 AraC family transcriptional regulator [Roseibium hamelinense]TWI92461.1 AraC-like DNA-binding protein [Roseibium hamelinense]